MATISEKVPKGRQAVTLREAGHSRAQIAAILGTRSSKMLSQWLHGVPAPAWARRPTAKDDLREIAVDMRREGRSYREIREVVGVSKSTLSLWLHDVALTDEQRDAIGERAAVAGQRRGASNRERRIRRDAATITGARAQVPDLSESELFVAGVVAYWAEGAKNRPWRGATCVSLVNSDPSMIRLFLAWLGLLGIGRRDGCHRVLGGGRRRRLDAVQP